MKLSEAEVRKWAKLYSDELMNFNDEDFEYIVGIGKLLDVILLPEDSGIIGYITNKDFDCKKKLSVVIFYCKPEQRGKYLRYMFREIERVAKQEGAVKVSIGSSISGYKEAKFNRMLEYFGYRNNGYIKEI